MWTLLLLAFVVNVACLCVFFITGGLAVLMADDAVVADVLLGVSGLFMLLTSVTFALAVKVWVSWHNQKIGKKQHDEVDADSELHSFVNIVDNIAHELESEGLKPINWDAFIVLTVDGLLFCGAFYTVFWAFREREYYLLQATQHLQITDYSLINGLVAILTPFLLFGSCFCTAVMFEHLTYGHCTLRAIIPVLLKCVKLRKYKNDLYWELEDMFFYKIVMSKNRKSLWHVDRNVSSWLFWLVIILSLQLCFTYFFDQAIVEYRYSQFCIRGFDCFVRENTTESLSDYQCDHLIDLFGKGVYCFRFRQLRHHEDVMGTLSKTFAFYLFLMALFQKIFSVAKYLFSLRKCKWWGSLFIIAGIGTCVCVVVLAAVWNDLLLFANVVSYIQIIYGALFCSIIGVLILKSGGRSDFRIPSNYDFNAQDKRKVDQQKMVSHSGDSSQDQELHQRKAAGHDDHDAGDGGVINSTTV